MRVLTCGMMLVYGTPEKKPVIVYWFLHSELFKIFRNIGKIHVEVNQVVRDAKDICSYI